MFNVCRFMCSIVSKKIKNQKHSLTIINCIFAQFITKQTIKTYRGQSGFDNSGRGYYWANEREQQPQHQQQQHHHHQQEKPYREHQQSTANRQHSYSQAQKPQQNNPNYYNNNNNNNAQHHTSSGIAPEYYQVKQSHNTPSNVQTVSSNAIGVDTGGNANANSSDRWSNKDNKDSNDNSKDLDKEKAR